MMLERKYRSDILLGITLVELLFLLVFVTLVCAGLIKDKGVREINLVRSEKQSLAEEKTKLKQDLKAKSLEIRKLEARIHGLEYQRDVLLSNLSKMDQTLFAKLPRQVTEAVEGVYPKLRPGGIGWPLCNVYKGYLFSLTMNEDQTFTVKCSWDAVDHPRLLEIPAINNVYWNLQEKRVGLEQFRKLSRAIFQYCEEMDCRFRVEADDNTESKAVFKGLFNFLYEYYYVARRW